MAQKIGRYEIKKELGRGGMATVYLARDPRFRRYVAIKVLPPQFTHDQKFQQRFEQEAQTIAALEVPAIVPVYDFGQQEHAPYLVMRYMAGGSLSKRINGHPMAIDHILAVLERVAPALDEVHQMGIIHRDIKPDNILFDAAGRAYLADFGIARLAEKTLTQAITGTPAYMSPEQVEVKVKPDWRSDIYSLGVTLFEMLSGKKPYVDESPTRQMLMHVLQPVPDILAANNDLPQEAGAIIDKVMAKDREDRYQSAQEMVRGVASLQGARGKWVGSTARMGVGEDATSGETDGGVDPEGAKILKQQERLDSDETVIESPPPTKLVEKAQAVAQREVTAAGANWDEARLPWSALPGWAWWGGAGIILILLIFGIRSVFGGGGDSREGNGGEEATAVVVAGETETQASEPPSATSTATSPPTATNTPTPTNTPTLEPSPTPTLDPKVPPPNPELGMEWIRPIDQMDMVYVPGGSFMMGSEEGDSDEDPEHEVTLDSFWIDKTEVTKEQFAQFLNESGNQEEGGVTWLDIEDEDARIDEQNGRFTAQSSFTDHPIVEVSWYGAAAYCEWAGGRLPSEAQWEYAARGPESRKYPWGEEDPTCDLAQFSGCDGRTVPVGSFEEGASWLGALDMAGNVWEWVNDWYDSSYYATSPVENPTGPTNGDLKVLRGGSWLNNAIYLRGAIRNHYAPGLRNHFIGFRCALPGS